MHFNKAPIIHEEAVSPPQHLPGLQFAWVLPGQGTKPSHRERVSAGSSAGTALLRPQTLGVAQNLQSGAASLLAPAALTASARWLAAALPIYHPSRCQKPPADPQSGRKEGRAAAAARRYVSVVESRRSSFQELAAPLQVLTVGTWCWGAPALVFWTPP